MRIKFFIIRELGHLTLGEINENNDEKRRIKTRRGQIER